MSMRPWIDAESVDREIAESSKCEECGSEMYFRSERRPAGVDEAGFSTPSSYRAFAVCANPDCANEIEF